LDYFCFPHSRFDLRRRLKAAIHFSYRRQQGVPALFVGPQKADSFLAAASSRTHLGKSYHLTTSLANRRMQDNKGSTVFGKTIPRRAADLLTGAAPGSKFTPRQCLLSSTVFCKISGASTA